MELAELLAYIQGQRLATISTIGADGRPQAAVIGFAAGPRFELIFDTLGESHKAQNLRRDPRAAFCIGGFQGTEQRCLQYEGIADEPLGSRLEHIQDLYYKTWPEGRERLSWPGLTFFRVRPVWIRYSDFSQKPSLIQEFDEKSLNSI